MFCYALNSIQRPNPNGEGTEVIKAKQVFEAKTDDFKVLEQLGAARKATNDEITIAKAQAARAQGQDEGADDESDSEPDAPATTSDTSSEPKRRGRPPASAKPDASKSGDDLGV